MCMEAAKVCQCGKGRAHFNLRENLLPPDVILKLYCPECSKDVEFDKETMLNDNGWIIVYDMDIARHYLFSSMGIPPEKVTPELIFDEGWATWKGMYPGEEKDRNRELEEIKKFLAQDPKLYFEKFREWANRRIMKMKEEGWRKAQRI